MTNFQTARDALDVSLESSGSAMKEHGKWSQSLEARLLKLKATWQSLSQSFMKSDFLKTSLDGIIGLVDGVNKLIDTFGTLPTLLTAFTAFKSLQGNGFFRTIRDEATGTATGITNAFKNASAQTKRAFENIGLKTDSSFKASIDADINALNKYSSTVEKFKNLDIDLDNIDLDKIFKDASDSARKFAEDGKLATDGIDGFIKSQKEAQVSTLAQNKSLSNARGIIKEYYSGCQNVKMGQTDFADAVSKTNPQLAKQLTTAQNARGAFAGYVTSLVGAKVATIALEAATMAMNMALTMGISALISWGISKLDEWIETADELKERIGEVTTKYEEQHNTMMKIKGDYDTSNEDSMISKYGELSKGVNYLGENLSLTADEYAEYQSIVNTIAEQMPSLVTGYNSQGDAILECAGSVDTLTEAYKNLILEQNKEVLDTGKDIFKDFNNDMDNLNDRYSSATDYLESLENIFKSEDIESAINNLSTQDAMRISDMLDEAGMTRDTWGSGEKGFEKYKEHILRVVTENASEVKSALTDAFNDVNAHIEDLNSYTEAYFSTAFLGGDGNIDDYSGFSDKMQNIISQITSGFDASFYEQFNTIEELEAEFDSILSSFNNLGSGEKAKLEAAFDLQTQFNGGKISYGEYVKGIQDASGIIDNLGLSEEVTSQLKLSLNTDEVTDNYEALKKRLTSDEYDIKMNASEAEEFLNGLSASEYAVAVDLLVNGEIDFSDFNTDSLKKYIEDQAKLQEAMSFTIAIDAETTGIEAFNTAMSESVSATGLSSESISTLKSRYAELAEQGYDLSSMFEETSNGIHLNREAVDEFERTLASNKLSEIGDEKSGHLGVLKDRYDELTEEIKNCTDAGERANLYSEQQQVAQKINDLAALASQYKGLTSAYNAWQNAESAGNERDMYENILSGFETIEDELSRGWADDGTIKFLELMTGETDLAGKSAKELKEVWNGLDDTIKNTSYSVKDFFTTDEDGNSTSKGVYNFLDAVRELEKSDTVSSVLNKQFKDIEGIENLVTTDEDGNIIEFDFSVVGGDEAIADALGISEELVQIMLRAADDAGFVVTIDGKWTQLADLKTSAEEAGNALNKLHETSNGKFGTDHKFNFGASSLEDLNAELEKAMNVLDKFRNKDGTINMKMEGAEEALEVASYFTATIDKLTEPKYMQLETNQVKKNLQEPLTKMQEFERLSKEKHQLKLTGESLDEVESKMDEIAKYLDELDEETQIELGIDGLTQEEIKSKLEKGEIEIPATVDIQMEMSDDIKDMRLLMMKQLGLASDEEVKLKIGYEIDDSLVDKLDDKEQEVVVKYIEENPEAWDKLSEEEKEATIKIVADGTDVESWEAEEKEALVKYIVDGGDVEGWTPEQKQSWAKYLVDHDDIDGWTPEMKQAWAQYLVDGGEVDGWTPEMKDAYVNYIVNGGEVDGWTPDDKKAFAKYVVDGGEPANYQPPSKTQNVKADLDSSEPDNYSAPSKDQEITANLDSSEPDNYQPKNKSFTVKAILQKVGDWASGLLSGGSVRQVVNGTANINGSAFVNGTTGKAYKQGDWGIEKTTTALTGELGQELVVYKNRYWTVGDNGAEFATIPRGAIVFNHRQTEELFKNGTVTSDGGRGKAFVNGNAFSSGSGGGFWENDSSGESVTVKADTVNVTSKTASANSNSSNSNSATGKTYKSSSSSSSDDSKEEFEETIDWIEIAIDRIERTIDQLDTKANSVYRTWSERNKNLTSEISKVGDEIELQQKAYDKYVSAANGVGLSEEYASKVRNGTIDIETITDETLKEKIDDYQNWYNKALDCQDAILELKEAESELYAQRFENVQSQYDGILQGFEHTENMLNEYISQAEEQGYIVSKKYYETLISNEKSNMAELKKEQSDLIAKRDEAVESGAIKKHSQEWYDMCASIDDVTQSIEESTTAILEFDNAMRDIDWSIFDLIQERISDVTEEADFLIELMNNDKLFDDDGKLTSQGLATIALHGQNYNTHMYQADDYASQINDIDTKIASGEYDKNDQEVINRRNELLELQRESILAAEDEKEAIRNLVEDGINLELDALQERIDLYEEAKDAEKDLYEYSKKVSEQTNNISSLRKQISGYDGDNSEESYAKVQELRLELQEAEDELAETEYERLISDTSILLDNLFLDYEAILNQRLDNVDLLLEQVVDGINAGMGVDGAIANALSSDGAIATSIASALGSEGAIASAIFNAVSENGSIKSILNKEATSVGTTLSTAMSNIWSVGDGNIKSVLSTYGKGFQDKQTTTNAVLGSIKADVNAMVDDVDKDAQKKIAANKTTTSAKKNPTTTSSSSSNKTNNTTSNKNTSSSSKSNITDDTLMGIAAAIWIYGSGSGWGNNPFRENKLKDKVGEANAKKVQSYINSHGSSGKLYNLWVQKGKNLDKYKYNAFKSGAKDIDLSQLAWTQENGGTEFIIRPSDGAILTPVAKGDSVLNAVASKNIWDMANSPTDFIKENLGLGNTNIPNGANTNNNVTQTFSNTLNFPNVKNYEEMLIALSKDPKFDKLINAMTSDRYMGKSSLAKNKAIR